MSNSIVKYMVVGKYLACSEKSGNVILVTAALLGIACGNCFKSGNSLLKFTVLRKVIFNIRRPWIRWNILLAVSLVCKVFVESNHYKSCKINMFWILHVLSPSCYHCIWLSQDVMSGCTQSSTALHFLDLLGLAGSSCPFLATNNCLHKPVGFTDIHEVYFFFFKKWVHFLSDQWSYPLPSLITLIVFEASEGTTVCYEVCSKSNALYFVMLVHDLRGGCW